MTTQTRLMVLLTLSCLTALPTYSIEQITVETEINDDTIIVTRMNGERLLLEKWSLRFSPLLFEGRTFYADVSPLWVTIYFEDRDKIKWTIEESLGRDRKRSPVLVQPLPRAGQSSEVIHIVQEGLTLLKYKPGPQDGIVGQKTKSAIKAFQVSEALPSDGMMDRATLLALSSRLYRTLPNNPRALDLAAALLAASVAQTSSPSSLSFEVNVIESRIEGEFEGWDGETVFILDNGQIWQQSTYAYTYHYAYRPKVTIVKTGGRHKMFVDGVRGSIYVRRLK